MPFVVGIDAGGSNTDVAVIDCTGQKIVSVAKVATNRRDMSVSLDAALAHVEVCLGGRLDEISSVSLCTTFATNALAEGRFSSAALILIGYPQECVCAISACAKGIAGLRIVPIAGGHDRAGNERAALDIDALEAEVRLLPDEIGALAISGFFGIRNPRHEIRARELVERISDKPVVCSFELSSAPNSVKRGLTAALNASLVPVVTDLIGSVLAALQKHGISAPLMVVRSDGTLMSAHWAARRPIETILSGPAASACGAAFLAGRQGLTLRDFLVVDIGGTTTDVIRVKDAEPSFLPHGAVVGRFELSVRSVDVRTEDLGGDSRVALSRNCGLSLGNRIEPFCRLVGGAGVEGFEGELLFLPEQFRDVEVPLLGRPILEELRRLGPLSGRCLQEAVESSGGRFFEASLADLLEQGVISSSGFTPTDALAVLGLLDGVNQRLSRMAAESLSAVRRETPEGFADAVLDHAADQLALAVARKVLADAGHAADWLERRDTACLLTRLMRNREEQACRNLSSLLSTVSQGVVLVGAPAHSLRDRVAQRLGEALFVPDQGGVAGAIGAAVGIRDLRSAVLIRYLPEVEIYRAHTPWGIEDFAGLDEAILSADASTRAYLEALSEKYGIEEGMIMREIRHEEVVLAGGERIYFGSGILYSLVQR